MSRLSLINMRQEDRKLAIIWHMSAATFVYIISDINENNSLIGSKLGPGANGIRRPEPDFYIAIYVKGLCWVPQSQDLTLWRGEVCDKCNKQIDTWTQSNHKYTRHIIVSLWVLVFFSYFNMNLKKISTKIDKNILT